MKIIEATRFDGRNIGYVFGLECVDGIIKNDNGEPTAFIKAEYTAGRRRVYVGDYLCKFANGMWQVFEGEAKVYATSKEEAKQIVKDSFGMRCGEIHASAPNILNWDIDMTPNKIVK